MSKIEREMIAEARAARQRQTGESICEVGDRVTLNGKAMIVTDVYRFEDIGADVPSAPNDEQDSGTQWWTLPQYQPVETPAKAPYPSEFLDALVYAVAERLANGVPLEPADKPEELPEGFWDATVRKGDA